MSLVKDLWLEETERRAGVLEAAGIAHADAWDMACREDHSDVVRDVLSDMVDAMREHAKGGLP